MAKWNTTDLPDLSGKLIVVTGSSRSRRVSWQVPVLE